MKRGGRMAAAIEVLADIGTRRRPVADALKDWGLSHRFAGSGDRAAIGNMVYDALRWRASSAWVMADESPRALVLATLARRWELGVDGLKAAAAGDMHAPPAPTPEEIQRLATADLTEAPDHVRADLPEWAAARFERLFGADWVEEGEALARRPSLDMRANRIKVDRGKLLGALGKFGGAETPYAPDGVRIPATAGDQRHPNVMVEPAFQKGWFEVQDEGSQIAALAVAPKAGERILDLCAGAGGKSLALASIMDNKGQVTATDNDRARLAPIFERVKRAGVHSVHVREARAPLHDLHGRMDAVLIDAPCTGSGVWRRRPDAKWRLTERALGNRLRDQAELLDRAAVYVKPGGRLVYVTCSLLADENEDQIAAFAGRHPEFTVVPPGEVMARSGVSAALDDAALSVGNGFVLSPRRTATDGFFVAVLMRA
jgi:16S rRNA (cytosine967-C5)-methyltransferase